MAEARLGAAAGVFSRWLGRVTSHDDGRVATANLVAVVLAWNTPFYPLYLLWVVGRDAFPAGLLTLCSLPLWVAVPLLSRRHPFAARVFLPLAGMANVVLCTWVLGVGSATELFLIPTTILSAMLFRPSERRAMLPLTCLPLILYFVLSGHYGPPLQPFTEAENMAMLRLNAGSVGTFSIFLGFLLSGLIGETPRG